ncbi:MAG: T9SS type A sorting domain-containing protein, partial [Bacteroidota bacterium]
DLPAGGTYTLTVQAGYSDTYFDVWIDFNDDLLLTEDELVINDAVCDEANVNYTFDITIPASAAPGTHILRFRTNWTAPVTDPCETYTYGNAADFKATTGGGTPGEWLSADILSGTLNPGESEDITVTFNSEGLDPGTYMGNLNFASNDPSNPSVDVPVELTVGSGPCPLPAPVNLGGEQILGTNDVLLWWDEPEVPGGVIRWDDGINNDGIGLTAAGTFSVAAHWEPDQLTQFDGLYLTDMDIFPRSDLGATFVLKVWTGATGNTEVYSEEITVVNGEWNSFSLATPVQINASTDLWIGYEITHPAGDFPAGCDAGPAVAGYGDMIRLGAGAWEPMSGLGLDYNWNIAGVIGLDAMGKPLARPIAVNNFNNTRGSVVAGNLPKADEPVWNDEIRALLGYNAYILIEGNWVKLNTAIIEELEFIHENVPSGEWDYKVCAVWEQCESCAEPISVIVGVNELTSGTTAIYPNPASDFVNIQSPAGIKQVTIMNNVGQVVYNKAMEMSEIRVNTADFETGVYVVRVQTASGVVTEKLIIQ